MLSCVINYRREAIELLYYFGRVLSTSVGPDMRYSLRHVGINGSQTGIYTRLCLPRQCKEQSVAKYLNCTQRILFEKISICSINSENDSYQFALYITMLILALFALLVLVATVRSYKAQKKNSRDILGSFDAVVDIKQQFTLVRCRLVSSFVRKWIVAASNTLALYILIQAIFIIGMFHCILPSSLGVHQSFFNLMLNARILVYIARISFSTYLVHLQIIVYSLEPALTAPPIISLTTLSFIWAYSFSAYLSAFSPQSSSNSLSAI